MVRKPLDFEGFFSFYTLNSLPILSGFNLRMYTILHFMYKILVFLYVITYKSII